MRKILLSVALVLVLLLTPLFDMPAAAAVNAGSCGDNVMWRFDPASGTMTISGQGPMNNLMWFDFDRRPEVKRFIVEPGVTYIGGDACSDFRNLVEVSLPEGVTGIGDSAFAGCISLPELKLPSTLQTIGDRAFSACNGLKQLVIPDGVTEFGYRAFSSCEALETVKLPKSLVKMSGSAFIDCVSLKSVTIPEGVAEIPAYAFSGCTDLEEVVLPVGTVSIGSNAFENCAALKELDLPPVMQNIGEYAFSGCSALERVEMPLVLEKMGRSAFTSCYMLKELSIPEGLAKIDWYTFSHCASLETVTFPASLGLIDTHAFVGCESLQNAYYAKSLSGWIVPDGNEPLLNAETIECFNSNGHTHSLRIVEAVEPTCSDAGWTKGVMCILCAAPFGDCQVIPATGQHDYEEGECSVCLTVDPDYDGPAFDFTDVQRADYFYKPVKWALRLNVTSGVGPGVFGPNNSCTRGQVVTFLWAAAGRPEPVTTENPFTDVTEADYYYKPVLWAVENGITGGVGDGLFGPHQTCTRGQIVTFLWAAVGKPEVSGSGSFSDVSDSDWFVQPVLWAAENNVTGGIGNGLFGPNNTCTRGQVVTFLYKVYG